MAAKPGEPCGRQIENSHGGGITAALAVVECVA
jgi:hypothetical protein